MSETIFNNLDIASDGTFNFFVPIEAVSKSGESEKDEKRLIQGIASTDDKDLQGEIVAQKGIDFSYFLKFGYINEDHKDGPEYRVGEPIEARLTANGLWIKAELYNDPNKPRADVWWKHIKTLSNSSSKRKVGFSIQGKVLRRDGNTIVKCWLQDVAITVSPVNTKTWAEICKSLSQETWCDHPWEDDCVGGCCACNGPVDEKEEKALTAGSMGRVITPQSLEGGLKVQAFKSLGDRITFNEAVQVIVSKGYSPSSAKAMADAIFTSYGIH